MSLYGDFEYEDDAEEYDECESIKDEEEAIKNGGKPTINPRLDDDEDDEDELKEPWLLDEVEEFIVWVKKAWKSRKPIGCKSLVDYFLIFLFTCNQSREKSFALKYISQQKKVILQFFIETRIY